ncbi:hypothetical protein H8B02_22990 [Bradyrhizobium sp. Pear77]|uniref:hypothetical protein n=1 Tax=Bradyrhizobium altum TaxID=1571202 RepID=UPI001E56370D|nr:hypothetical protein [Bradyrhizobium altum]MCC8956189.1 hypothetical protein [Bradyrhizobium altum]
MIASCSPAKQWQTTPTNSNEPKIAANILCLMLPNNNTDDEDDVLPTWRETMIVTACTGTTDRKAGHSMDVFANYLANNGELTPYLRNWFVPILRADPGQKFVLDFKRRDGFESIAKDPSLALEIEKTTWQMCTHSHGGSKPTIEPLVQYLEAGGDLTPFFRQRLVAMLLKDRGEKHYLEFKLRQGRPSMWMEDWIWQSTIVDRFEDLCGVTVTHKFRWELEHALGLETAEPIEIGERQIFRLGVSLEDEYGKYVEHTISLEMGTPLSAKQARIITAAEYGTSDSTVKRILRRFDEAARIV